MGVLPKVSGRTKSEKERNADELADEVPRGIRVDDEGREQMSRVFLRHSTRRDVVKAAAAAGGGVAVALLAGRLVGQALGAPGSATGGTTISDTDVDAKRIAGIRIATEFMTSPHAGTIADNFPGSAIQAALNDLPPGGGFVFIPLGIWNVSSPLIVIQSNVRICGYGSATYLRTDGLGFTPNQDGMIRISGNYTGEIVENLLMDGTNTDTCRGVLVSDGTEALIQNCEIKNFLGTLSQRGRGVSISQNGVNTIAGPFMQCIVANCFFKNNQIGIVLHKTRFSLTGNRCLGNAWDGFYVDGNQAQGSIVGNTVEGGGRTGVNLVASDRVTIADNYFLNNQTNIQILGSPGGNSPAPCIHNLVSGNVVEGAGIFLASGSHYNVIIGNWVIGVSVGTSPNGIYLYNGAMGNLIIGNVCSLNARSGIALLGAGSPVSNNLLEGNLCFNNGLSGAGWAGIMIAGSSNNRIRGNRCFDDQMTQTQSYGIAEGSGADGNAIIGNDVAGNLAAGIVVIGPNTVVRDNLGYATESRGVATIPSGQTSVTVPHGLVAAPLIVVLGPEAAAGGAYWSADAMNLTISVPSAVSANTAIAWKAEV